MMHFLRLSTDRLCVMGAGFLLILFGMVPLDWHSTGWAQDAETAPAAPASAAPGDEAAPVEKPAQPKVENPPAAPAKPDAAAPPLGRFITVTNPIDVVLDGRIRRIATALQTQAMQEKRKAVLILEITDGPSRFGDVRELADFLSRDIPAVTTVAWIPDDVRGYNVILALACNDIVMHPKASIGDIGRGKAVAADAQSFVVNMINRRHNPKLHVGTALGMMDPQKSVVWVRRPVGVPPQQVVETEVLTQEEFDGLIQAKMEIIDRKTVKERGTDGMFSGSQARTLNFLVSGTLESRTEVAALYRISTREDSSGGNAPIARRFKVEGVIEPRMEDFLRRQIHRAVSDGANLLIIEIDSPGGYYLSAKNIAYALADLDPKEVRTVAYVSHEAISGGALIALGCDEIYLTPGAKIGDIGPLDIREGGAFEWAPRKILSLLLADLRDLAARKQRPVAVALAMADKEIKVFEVKHRETGERWYMTQDEIDSNAELWIKGGQIPESAPNLITVNGTRANELRIAEPPVANFDELKQRTGIPPEVELRPVKRGWVDVLIYILDLPVIKGLLFVLAFMFIFIEMHVNTGFFGICAVTCFGIFFWGQFAEGNANWLELILFVIGLGCVAIEIFLLPGFGVFGVCGGLLVIGSLILASQTFYIPATQAEYSQLAYSMGTVSGSIVAFIIAAAVLGRFLPQMPLMGEMVLVPPGANSQHHPKLRPEYSGAGGSAVLDRSHALVGRRGITLSILRPAGKAQIEDQFVDVVSDGPYIEQGMPVEVVEVNGNRVVVRQV